MIESYTNEDLQELENQKKEYLKRTWTNISEETFTLLTPTPYSFNLTFDFELVGLVNRQRVRLILHKNKSYPQSREFYFKKRTSWSESNEFISEKHKIMYSPNLINRKERITELLQDREILTCRIIVNLTIGNFFSLPHTGCGDLVLSFIYGDPLPVTWTKTDQGYKPV